jgi:putative glutamine amidotransferase
LKAVAITQRVIVVPGYGERRDCLDQAWSRFLAACELIPIAVPNIPATAISLCESVALAGYVLTGGNDLASLGGDAPERDATEHALLDLADRRKQPVLGVCRGMQVIQDRHAIPLRRVAGHVAASQTISVEGRPTEVNSYHHFAAMESRPPLDIWATADDGVVKAVRDANRLAIGIMWHPERFDPFRPADIALFREVFGVA